jgi:hypothetical protein
MLRNPNLPGDRNAIGVHTVPSGAWNVIIWALALGMFAVAMVLSYRESHWPYDNWSYNLRTPAILLLDTFLATAVAFGFAVRGGAFTRWVALRQCIRFGLWSAAVFRLLPPIINEEVLFHSNMGTFDAPYVVLGACVHGGLAAVLAFPYAVRVLYPPESRRLWAGDDSPWEMCGTVVLIFYIVAGAARLLTLAA